MKTELKEAIEHLCGLTQLNIPYYAYGDNEAACQMAQRINEISEAAYNIRAMVDVQPRPSSEAIKAAMNKTAEYTMEDFNVALNGGKMIESWEEFKDRIAGKLGSGVNLPLNLTIWKKAQSMNYSDFAKWFNEELKNNTPPTK